MFIINFDQEKKEQKRVILVGFVCLFLLSCFSFHLVLVLEGFREEWFYFLLVFFPNLIWILSGKFSAQIIKFANSHYQQPPNRGLSNPSTEILTKQEEFSVCLSALITNLTESRDLDRICSLPLSSICSAAPRPVLTLELTA